MRASLKPDSLIPMQVRAQAWVLVGALLGCDANLGSAEQGETGGETGAGENTIGETGEPGDGDGDQSSEPFPCSAAAPCPEGWSCFNGLCAFACTSDADCGADEYCGVETDSLGHPKQVPTCGSDQDCAGDRVCVDQYCVSPDGQSCDLEDFVNDGCASNAICIEDLDDEGQGNCHEMPACAADESCPVGLGGAVCNDGYLPNEDAICLLGNCDVDEHCPAEWACIRYAGAVLGFCSSGAIGAPCVAGSDCISGTCFPLPGLGGGFCQ